MLRTPPCPFQKRKIIPRKPPRNIFWICACTGGWSIIEAQALDVKNIEWNHIWLFKICLRAVKLFDIIHLDDLSINYLPILVPCDFDKILVCTSFGSPFYASCPGNVCGCVLHEGESFAISGTYQIRKCMMNLWNT